MALVGMLIVDAWLLYSGAMGELRSMEQNRFYEKLALELVGNDFTLVGLRDRTDG